MAAPVITASKRMSRTKGDLKRIRATGDIPAVIYGKSRVPQSLVLPGADFRMRAKGHRMIEVRIDNEQVPVVIQDIMVHPIDRQILHIELHAVAMDEQTQVFVPIILNGLELVEKHGGIVQQQVREAEVIGLPQSIPDFLTLDISAMQVGDSLRMKDIPLTSGITLCSPGEEVVLSVIAPKLHVVEEPVVATGQEQRV
ncbi:MAG: 50S ribosomal protein L25 [Firmicutes bacterium]|nr:50S ribosomal protein L25 [Bacillota bacterium]